MTIEHEESGNRFVMKMKDDEAFISYDKPNDRTLNIFHTEVPEAFEGQGVGSKLARYALDYARAKATKSFRVARSSIRGCRSIMNTTTSSSAD